jgi:arsenite methyltransferase
MTTMIDAAELRGHVRAMYTAVAEEPAGDFHFEVGRAVAARLGYPEAWLDAVPADALASYAGVGHFLDLADIRPGESVLDLGSGSGTDAFIAAHLAGPSGTVIGVDMTAAQLEKSRRLGARVPQIGFLEGFIEDPPGAPESFDVVISNGVINLAPDKAKVFRAAARLLRPGGRLALADIVSTREIVERTRANVALWAACIAGAATNVDYLDAIQDAGLTVKIVRENDYRFLSPRAQTAAAKYGVTSVSVLAVKEAQRERMSPA